MPTTSSVTHADLAPSHPTTDLGSKTGALLTISCSLSGFFCFVLCLLAEATRSQVTWRTVDDDKGGQGKYECVYSGNGRIPLMCATIAFVGLAVAMLVQHAFMLLAIIRTAPPTYVSWDPDSGPTKALTWQAGFFFISTWICFTIGEIMLLIGLSVESGHRRNWSTPRPNCLVVREGVFTAAGVFALVAVLFAAGLYATALRVAWICQEQENVHRRVMEAAELYASPRSSPPLPMTSAPAFDPIIRQNQGAQSSLNKHSNYE